MRTPVTGATADAPEQEVTVRRPLEGILVVSLEQAVAGPFASRKLADSGARVVKVERPAGDFARTYDDVVHGESAYFVWLNRGKESIVLDLKNPGEASLLRRMIARADVFVQNLRPGAAAKAGFGSDDLRSAHTRLITCDISGYGESGPYAHMKAYDNLLQGETGLLAVTGSPDAPAKVGISVCDIAAGMHAYAAITEALFARTTTSQGQAIKVSLFDCMADWMSVPYLHHAYGGAAPSRNGLQHASIAPYGPYTAKGGHLVLIAIQNDREWSRFCAEVLNRPSMTMDPQFRTNTARVANRDSLRAAIQSVFSELELDALLARLSSSDIAFAMLKSVDEFARHPQLRVARISTPSGPVDLPADPVTWYPERPGGVRAVPALGEHTERIRREFQP